MGNFRATMCRKRRAYQRKEANMPCIPKTEGDGVWA